MNTEPLSVLSLMQQINTNQLTHKLYCKVYYVIGCKHLGDHELVFIYDKSIELKSLEYYEYRTLLIPRATAENILWDLSYNSYTDTSDSVTVKVLENYKEIFILDFYN